MAKKRGKRVNHEGTIYQRKDGRWTGQLTTPDGRKTVYADDPAGVLEKLDAMKATLAKGLPLPDEKLTLGAWLKEWIASVSNVRQSSWARYETLVRVHLMQSPLANTPLVKLTKQQVLAFYKQKQQNGLSSTTVRHIHIVLGRALREAMEDHHIPYNVCQRLRAPKPVEREMLYLTREQAQHFLGSIRGHRSFALFALALTTGMREGELLGLRWKDVTLEGEKPCLHVRVQAITRRDGGKYHCELEVPKTRRSRRRVDLGPDIVQELRAHEARQKLEKRMAGDAWQHLSLVFPNSRGGIAYGGGLWALFQRLAAKAGLPDGVTFHTLRHTAITLALEAGQSLKVVAEMVGDDEATILRVYAHVTPQMRASLAATMNSLLAPPDVSLQSNLQSKETAVSGQA